MIYSLSYYFNLGFYELDCDFSIFYKLHRLHIFFFPQSV
jgi:hypothetical protein